MPPTVKPAAELVPDDHVIVLFGGTGDLASAHQLEAYERLLHDALIGDRTLFTRSDGIERLWEVSAPLLADPPSLHEYLPGSWGPPAADQVVKPRRWHLPEV